MFFDSVWTDYLFAIGGGILAGVAAAQAVQIRRLRKAVARLMALAQPPAAVGPAVQVSLDEATVEQILHAMAERHGKFFGLMAVPETPNQKPVIVTDEAGEVEHTQMGLHFRHRNVGPRACAHLLSCGLLEITKAAEVRGPRRPSELICVENLSRALYEITDV